MNELYSNQQYVNLLKLVIAKMRLLNEQINNSEDEEQKKYLRLALKPYRILLGYLLHCKTVFKKEPKNSD